ncbi:hypothetical protein D3C86_2043890 [compost metagenome]
MDILAGWRVSDRFSDKERAALQWAEELTDLEGHGGSDASFELLKQTFTDQEISDLTLAIANINAFNRIAIGMRQ